MTLNERRFYFGWVVAALLLGGILAQAQTIGFVPGSPSVNENGTNVTLVVTRSPATGLARVSYASADLTATAGLDYTAVAGTLTFTNGETFKTIVVPILEDAIVEAHETFEVNLFNVVGGVLGRTNVVVTIYDNDTLIAFTSPTYTVNESDPSAAITLVRSGGTAGAASVLVGTRNGTATAGSDFVATSMTMLFTNGQVFSTFLVPLIDDCVVEGNETFTVFLTNAFGASIGAISNATVTIVDNDSLAGTLIIRSVSRTLAPEGSVVNVTIGRLCSALGTVTVDLVPLNSTNNSSSNALLGLDYTFVSSNTVTWLTNDSTDKIISINIIDDNLVELNEVILLGLANATGGALINPNASTARITIDFDDQPAGAADRTYNPSTAFNPTPGANNTVRAVAVNGLAGDPNFGTTVIAGDFTSVNGVVRNRLARLDASGFLDPSFDPLDGADNSVSAIAIQPDGRILVAGGFAAINGVARNGVARLLDTGLPDTSFDPGLGLNGAVAALALQPDGKVVVAGDFTTAGGDARRQVARFNADGSVDLTFDPGLGPDGSPLAVAMVPGAGGAPPKILVGGAFSAFNGVVAHGIVRLNADGSVDRSFAPVAGSDGIVFSIAVQANGASLLGGSFNAYDGVSRRSIVRVNPNGTVDPSFDPGTAVEGSVFDIAIQADGLPLLAGQFTAFDGVPRNNVARLNADGSLDTSFLDSYYNQTLQGPNGLVLSVALQPDNNVIVGGSFDTVGGGPGASDVSPRLNVARLIGGNPPPLLNRPGNVEFVAASFSVDENVAGGVVIVTARRTGGNLLPLLVDYATSDRTAVAGVDYQTVRGTLSWNDLESLATNKTFAVPILNNARVDGNRTFEITLSNPRSGNPAPTTEPAPGFQRRTVVTIIDDDFTVGVFGFAGPVFEVSEAVGNATITVVRTNGSTGAASVQYATAPGTATAGVDYLSRSGTLIFSSGQTRGSFTVPIINDVAPEFEESILLTLSNPTGGATLGLANAVLLIMDNDPGPGSFGSLSFTTNNFSVSETNGFVSVAVRRTSGGVGQVEVDVQTGDFLPVAPGNARANLDYTPVTRHLIFPAGSTNSQTVFIPILQDRLVEGVEVFAVWLTNVTGGARLGYLSNATVSIVDANTYGQITFSQASYFISENGGTSSIRIDRVGGDAEQVAVEYLIIPGTAVPNVDFVASSGTLIFEDGQTSTNLLIPIIDNQLVEPNRTLSIVLSNFNKATPGRFTNVTLTIFDDESLAAPAGSLNTGFDSSVGANAPINALLLVANEKLVIAGQFTAYGGLAINRIARLNPDGGLDVEFQPGTGANGEIQTLALQPDQKIVVGGRFTAFNGANRNYLTRLNAEGSLDSAFNIGSGPDNPVFAVAVRGDGKVAVGGSFTTFNGVGRANFVMVTTNGVVDPGFNVGAGVNGQVFAVAVQPDGKVLIGGDFTAVNNTSRVRLARFNGDGTLDLTFDPGSNGANGSVRVIAVQPDGRVLVGGSFTSISGYTWNHLARLNADGSPDRFFDPGTGANADVLTLALQPAPDNRILVGGTFTNFNSITRNYLTRLTTSGAVDSTINFGLGANGPVFALALQADRQINVAGAFTQFDGVPRNRLVRLLGGDNFGPGEFQFLTAGFTVSESATNVTLVVRRVGGSGGTVTVNYATADGTARAGVDYSPAFGTLIFRDAEVIQTFPVSVFNNLISDGDRFFTVTLGNSSGAVLRDPTVATVIILDDDTVLNFSSSSYAVIENVPGARAFITVERLGGSAGVVSVQYLTATGGTAIPYPGFGPVGTANYTNAAGVLTWADGDTASKTFAVGIIDDLLTNANRTINLALFGATNVTAGTPITLTGQTNATLTIVDNEFGRGVVGFSQPSFDVLESSAVATITVVRTNGSAGVVSVDFGTSDGTARAGVNYVTTRGTLSFADSEQSKTFPITILVDGVSTPNLTLTVTLSNPTGGAGLGFQDSAVVTILNDDQAIYGSLVFSATNYVVGEAAGEAVVEVQRRGGRTNAVTVFYTTTGNGTAPTNDYSPVSGNLIWGNLDSSSRFIRVPIINNNLVDGDRTVEVELRNPTGGAAIGTPGRTLITITDDDFLVGTLGFGQAVFDVTENATNAIISVVRTNGSTGTVGASYTTLDGTALNGRDYTGTNGFLVFTNGVTNQTFTVPLIDNTIQDGTRFFGVQLFGFAGGAAPGLSGAQVRIADDEGPAGSVDVFYGLGAGFNGTVYTLAVTTNRLAYVAGDFTAFNGTNLSSLVRLNPDGSIDGGFNVGPFGFTGSNASVRSVVLYTTNGLFGGKVVFGGLFTSVGGVGRTNVARVNADGTPDTNFVASVDNLVNAVAVQNNGSVVIGGLFTVVNGTNRNFVARLNFDGSLDTTFSRGLGPNGAVRALALQPDGKTIIGGEFTTVDGFSSSRLARLNSDGSVDGTFLGGGWIFTGAVYTLALQPDGRILVGGAFLASGGLVHTNLVRLEANGLLDDTFNPSSPRNEFVSALALQPNGRVVVGGAFTTFSGLPENRITRLETNGTVDLTINFGTGANDYVAALALQSDGKILAGGAFTNFNGVAANHFVRLHGGENLGAGVLAFSAPTYAVSESGTNAVITVVRKGGLSNPVSVTYATTTGGTALPGIDYQAVSGVLYFAPGVTAINFPVPVFNDQSNRGDRTVVLALSNVSGGAGLEVPPTAVLTIQEDDSLISFASATYSVSESTTNALITLVRSGGLVGSASVTFATTTNGTAVAGVNFQPTNQVVTFPPGTNAVTVVVGVLDDGLVIGNLTVGLVVSNAVPTNSVALGALTNATLTIVESRNAPGVLNFASTNFVVDEAAGSAAITVVRSGGSLGLVSVQYFTADGSAQAGLDYDSVSGVLSFADGEMVKSFVVPVRLDTLIETNEFANLFLANPSGGALLGATNRAVLTIVNNDRLIFGSLVFSATNYAVSEAAGEAVLTVRRVDGFMNVVSVFYTTTTNGTAPAADFSPVSGSLSWAHLDGGDRFIRVPIINNPFADGDRTVEVILSNVSGGARIGTPGSAFVTIIDDDLTNPGALGFAQVVFSAVENGTNAIVTVVRTNGSTGVVGVSYATQDGSALNGRDYLGTSGFLVFTDGMTNQTFTVPLLDNTVQDGSRFFRVVLFGFANGAGAGRTSAVVRIADDESAAGSVDPSYNTGLGPDAVVYALGLQGNGQLIVGGEFGSFNGITRSRVARVGVDGTLDLTFDAGVVSFASGVASVRAVAPHTNGLFAGRVVVAGFFNSIGGQALNHVARLDANGAVDASFNSFGGPNNGVYAVAVQADGRVVVGGAFTAVAGTNRSFVARLTAAGGLDAGFDPQVGPDGPVRAVAIQNDGKVIIGGDFSSVNSVARPHIARLNANGTLDPSFVPFGISATGSVYAVTIQMDGKIVVGGQFLAAGGPLLQTNVGGVVRLNADGSLDTSFSPGMGTDDSVSALALQPDGKVILGGAFVTVNGIARNRIARLNADGSLDASLNVGSGANNLVTSLAVQGDGKIILGGAFTRFNGATNNYLARLFGGANLGSGTLAFSAPIYQVSEGASNAVVVVIRSGGTFNQVTVALTVTGGTAVPNANYFPLSTNILVFAEGQASAAFAIRLIDDKLISPDRTIVLNLSAASGGAALDTVTDTTVLIQENDCLVSFSAAVYNVVESAGSDLITVVRTGGTVENLTVNVVTGTNGTATAGTDFTAVTTTVQFTNGQASATFSVPITDDGLVEGNETIPLGLSIPAAFGGFAFPGQFTNATLVIIDNDGGPGTLGFATNAFAVLETAGFATITVVRTNGSSGAVSVDYTTVAVPNGATGGLAGGPGVDFLITQGTLAFVDGESVKTFTVPIFADQLIEGDEPLSLALSNPTGGAALGLAAATLTIVDDVVFGGRFEFVTDTFRVGEGETNAVITVRRTGLNSGRVTVDFAVADITAVAGIDYLVTSGSLVFPDAGPGNLPTVQTTNFLVPIIDDSLLEPDEQIRLILRNPSLGSALGTVSNAVLTIVDNDVVLAFSTNRFFVDEDAGNAHVLVVRTGNTNSAVTFQVATRNGTATNGIDYLGFTNAFAFGPGEIFRDVPVPVIGNTTVDGNRTVNLRLLNPFPTNSVQLGLTNTAILTIVDNDSGFVFAAPNFFIGEAAGSAVITVLRTGSNAAPITVDFQTADGTALAVSDYQATSGRLTFAAGESSKSFSVVIRDDTLPENDETFSVLLSNPQPAGIAFLGALSTATVTIVDNDAMIGFAATSYSVNEADGIAGILLVRSGATNRAVSVNVSTGIGTATAGADYVATNGPVVFAPGVFSVVFNVAVILDNVVEGSETVPLVLSLPSAGVTLGPITAATLTISDNAGTFAFSASAYNVIEDATNAVLTVVRTAGAAGTVNIDYQTLAGTASAGLDYAAVSGTLVFAPGVLTSVILVPIIDDRLIEAAETFTVSLRISDPFSGAKLGAISNATVTILDNDTPSGNDFRFDPAGWITNGSVFSVVVQPDGKLLVGGSFRVVLTNIVVANSVVVTNYLVMNGIARLNNDGSLDATFNPGAGPNDAVRSIVLQPDGKVLIGGDFTYVAQPGYIRNRIARLNADGSLDTTFTPNPGADGPVIAVALQPDGKVLIGGSFGMVFTNVVVINSVSITNLYALTNIARLNISGTLDTTFGLPTGPNQFLAAADQPVFDIAVQADGQIVIAGAFTHYNGTPRNYLARLNTNGSLDPSFDTGTALDASALALAIQSFDGKIVAVGVFGQSLPPSPFPITNLAVRSFAARFQTDGTLDTGFAPSIDSSVLAVAVQSNGQIVIAGDFTRVTGVPRARIARLNPDGVVDLTFDPGAGADAIVYTVSLGADGKVFLGGDFTHFDGVPRNRVARLNGTPNGTPNVAVLAPTTASGPIRINLQGVPLSTYRIEATTDLKNWTPVAFVTNDVNGQSTFTDTASPGMPHRFYRVIKLQ